MWYNIYVNLIAADNAGVKVVFICRYLILKKEEFMVDDKIFINIKEAAKLAHLGTNRLYKIVKTQNCPFVVRKGNYSFLIRKKSFEKWLETVDII